MTIAPAVAQVFCEEDGGHAAAAKLTLDGVAVGQGRPQATVDVGHAGS